MQKENFNIKELITRLLSVCENNKGLTKTVTEMELITLCSMFFAVNIRFRFIEIFAAFKRLMHFLWCLDVYWNANSQKLSNEIFCIEISLVTSVHCSKRSHDFHSVSDEAKDVFMSQTVFIEINPPVRICGDTHGQYSDVLRLFSRCGFPPLANYLFLGDYVDRGEQNLETVALLFCYKVWFALPSLQNCDTFKRYEVICCLIPRTWSIVSLIICSLLENPNSQIRWNSATTKRDLP